MYKVINFFILTLIIIFIFGVLNFYLSSKNIDQRNFNRTNIDKILERENRIQLYQECLNFLKTRVNLDLALFKDDIWSH